jgi:hypothetical protein
MRCLILIAAVLLHPALIPPAGADDKADRERKVKVALALSAKPGACGRCREDAAAVRAEAHRDRKPIALFVGGCEAGLGCVAETAGAIPVKAASYAHDGQPAASKRIVILEPKADGSGFVIDRTLPAGADAKQLDEAVKAATPKAKAAPSVPTLLNWQL